MQRQIRNRRSDSSCSNYSQHSSSLAHLQPIQLQTANQRKLDYTTIQKEFITNVYNDIRQHELDKKKIQSQMIAKWRESTRKFIKQLRTYMKQNQTNVKMYKYSENKKNQQISNLKLQLQQQKKILQFDKNKLINQLHSQFYRRQLEYKQTINKFVDTLHKSQRYWTKVHTQLTNKLKKAQQLFRQKLIIDMKNQQVYDQIANFADEMYNQHDDSLRSISLSNDQIILQVNNHNNNSNGCHMRQQSRRNTIDISSIEQIDQIDEGAEDCEPERGNQNQDDFEQCLIRLICWGFFVQKNQSSIKKIIDITKSMENPQNIIKEPIFPILLESIKLNLDLYQEPSLIGSRNNSSIEDGRERFVMRDIENQRL